MLLQEQNKSGDENKRRNLFLKKNILQGAPCYASIFSRKILQIPFVN
jgi:hypothetical protein